MSIRPTTATSPTIARAVSSEHHLREWLRRGIVRGYYEARRNKRNTASQSLFESNLFMKLAALTAAIFNFTYNVSRSIAFIIFNTVMREVFAAQFVDRIVHHLLYDWLSPIFEPLFIEDSYSCRKGKGTDYGVRRLQHHIRSVSRNGTRPCWILKLDLSGYFMSIVRQKLYDIIVDTVLRKGLDRRPEWPIIRFLLRKVIFNDPTKGCRVKGKKSEWKGLPRNKSLFWALIGCGLPIGNLTSQLFSNIYLNVFDQYVKKVLKVKHYGRYVDDFYIVAGSKEELLALIEPIRMFLLDELGLTLHPRKIVLKRSEEGITFLGKTIVNGRVRPCRRTVRKCRNAMAEAYAYEEDPYRVRSMEAAWGNVTGRKMRRA